jgi:hypothetical protein
VVAASLAAAGLSAQAPPALELSVPEGTFTVGDTVPVRVAARGGQGLLWGELRVELQNDGPWELVDGPRPVVGSRPPAWELSLAPMAVGEQPLPTISVSARPQGGEPLAVAAESPPTVAVASVLPPDEEVAPAPLRDPLGVRGFPWEWVLPIGIALLPLVALAAWRRRRGPTDEEALAARLSPLEQLQALAGELGKLIGTEPAETVCDGLAAGVRRYLERRSGEPAQEMTSHELRMLARSSKWPEPAQRSLGQVMSVVDGVRFGRRPTAAADLRGAIDRAVEVGTALESHFDAAAAAEAVPE